MHCTLATIYIVGFFFFPELKKIFFFLIFLGVQLIYNVVLVSAVQQSESVIHISTLFQILFPYRLLQSIEQSSLCYTVGPYQLSILYIVVCMCQSQSSNLSYPPPGNHKFIFYICNSIFVLQISSFVAFFQIPHIAFTLNLNYFHSISIVL